VTEVTLRKSSRMLEFETCIENTAKDHRLRVAFPTCMKDTNYCYVDSPFDIVKRDFSIPDSSGWYEEAARTLPSHSFISMEDGKKGLTVLHWGIPEYEVVDDPTRAIKLTLLRCFGTAGNPTEKYEPQPLAQCQGKHTFIYAVYCHGGETGRSEIAQKACQYTSALRVAQCSGHEGILPLSYSFVTIDNPVFIVTALKRSEEGSDIIIRGYNSERKNIKVLLSSAVSLSSASKVTLEEKNMCDLELHDAKTISFEAGKFEIVSIRLCLKCV
jgi:alpha-mannosidase